MTYFEGNYYLAATTWGDPFVGLTMRKAGTVAELKEAAPNRIWQDWTPERCCNFWAPEFFLLDGPSGPRWYGYYSAGPASCCDNQRIHVIESLGMDPLGPYEYKGRIDDSSEDRTIDGSILQLDGSLYLLYAARIGEEPSQGDGNTRRGEPGTSPGGGERHVRYRSVREGASDPA